MGRIFKAIVVLLLIGFVALTGYAYLGNMTPPQTPVTKPVILNAE